MLKTSVETKREFISLMIKLMKENELKGYEILEKTGNIDVVYKKALRYNRINKLIGIGKDIMENNKIVMETNEEFIKGIEAADTKIISLTNDSNFNNGNNSGSEIANISVNEMVKPIDSNIKMLVKAIEFGVKVFDLDFINMLNIDNTRVGMMNDKIYTYYVREIDSFINVNL